MLSIVHIPHVCTCAREALLGHEHKFSRTTLCHQQLGGHVIVIYLGEGQTLYHHPANLCSKTWVPLSACSFC